MGTAGWLKGGGGGGGGGIGADDVIEEGGTDFVADEEFVDVVGPEPPFFFGLRVGDRSEYAVNGSYLDD